MMRKYKCKSCGSTKLKKYGWVFVCLVCKARYKKSELQG